MVKDALASLAKSIGGLMLLPVLLCLSAIPFYLFGAFLLWMGVWNDPASVGACQIYGWIPHLADCPERAESMILTGQILLDGQPIPRAQEGSGEQNIAFLIAFVGPREVGIDEFYSNPRYTITIRGTTAMEGEEITFQLQLSPSCNNPTKCAAPETIPFKSGMREVDLHFESNR